MPFKFDTETAHNLLGGALALFVLIAVVVALISFVGWFFSLPFSVIFLLIIVAAVAFVAGRASVV